MRPVASRQLGQQPGDMRLHSSEPDIESLRDLSIGKPPRNQQQHIPLPIGDALKRHRSQRTLRPPRELRNQPPSNPRRQQSIPPGHNLNSRNQIPRRRVLEQKPTSPSPQRRIYIIVKVEGSKNQHPHPTQLRIPTNPPRSLNPIHLRHPHIHQHNIRPNPQSQLDGLQPVSRLPNRHKPRRSLHKHPKTTPNQRLIIRDQHLRHSDNTATTQHLTAPRRPFLIVAAPPQSSRTTTPSREPGLIPVAPPSCPLVSNDANNSTPRPCLR